MNPKDHTVDRRTFLSLTSALTLSSFTPGLAQEQRREFSVRVHSHSRTQEVARISNMLDELTRGLILEKSHLVADCWIDGSSQITLKVCDEDTGAFRMNDMPMDIRQGLVEIHRLYAELVCLGVFLAPEEPYLTRSLSDHFLAFQHYHAGISCFKSLIETHPDKPLLRFHLGMLFDRCSRKKDAYAAFRATLRLDPEDATVLYNLGVIAGDLGHAREAEQWFLKALAHNPRMEAARTRLNLYRRRASAPRFKLTGRSDKTRQG